MRVKKNLDKIIYDQIIDSFILGEYKMDDAISLDVLCEKYEVSRTPVSYTHLQKPLSCNGDA